jgi:hypothetical protein
MASGQHAVPRPQARGIPAGSFPGTNFRSELGYIRAFCSLLEGSSCRYATKGGNFIFAGETPQLHETVNLSICFYFCFTVGTGGVTTGLATKGFGASLYVKAGGDPQSSRTVSTLGCYVTCLGAYKNSDGPGGGIQVGVGTRGVFFGPSCPPSEVVQLRQCLGLEQ